jgi:polyisoprenoid-binding protein YceI
MRCFGIWPSAIVVITLSTPALVAAQTPAKPAQGPGKTYAVDVKASRVYVRVDPDGRGHPHGVEGKLASGELRLGASKDAGELVFDLTSFQADTAAARRQVGLEGTTSASEQRSVTRTMRGSRILDTEQYPKATFVITSITPKNSQKPGDPGAYQLDGRMSLHGAEQPLRFDGEVKRGTKEGTLQVTGQFQLLQTDYNIKPYSALLGAVKVADALQIHGDLQLIPKTAEK